MEPQANTRAFAMPGHGPGAHAIDAPAVRRRPLHAARLLALGWGAAALLPVGALALMVHEYRDVQAQSAVRTQLVLDAVERQLKDRLFLVSRQLIRAAKPQPQATPWVIPMVAVTVRPATPEERQVPEGMTLGQALPDRGRWWLPVTRRSGGSIVTARIEATLFEDVVGGYRLGKQDFVSLIHEGGSLVARSVDNDRVIGQRIANAGLFSPEHRARRQGTYAGESVLDGVAREYSYRRMEMLPLAIMVGTEQRTIAGMWARPAAAIFAFTLVIVCAWGWLVRRFSAAQAQQARLIGDLRSAVGALGVNEERLRQAHALALLGEYEWDTVQDRVRVSGSATQLHGADPDSCELSLASYLRDVHDDDRQAVRTLLDTVMRDGQPVEAHFRVYAPGGEVRRVLVRAAPAQDATGRPVVRGVQQDVTELVDARERAQQAEAQYRFLFEHNPLPMWVFDRDSLRIVAVNDAMVSHYGYSRMELVGSSMLDIRPVEDRRALNDAVLLPAHSALQGRVWTHLHKDGHAMRMSIFSHDIEFDGRAARLVAAHDVTEREQAEQRFRLVARATSDAVYDYDIARGEIWWSETYYARFGYEPVPFTTPEEWVSHIHPADQERVSASFYAALETREGDWQEQYRYCCGDGTYVTVQDRGFLLRDATGRPSRMVGGMLDISERQRYEDQLAYRATHDELTGLPNRQLLQDRLNQAILNAQRYGREAALIFIDLDDFKLVNDSLGHTAGDNVLREVATRLKSVARETDTVARFGGDEFVIVLTEQSGEQGLTEVIRRITGVLAQPISVGGTTHQLTASIGWCRYPDAGQDAESLLMHGDLAMYQAKRQGRNRAVVFQSEFADGMSRRLQLVSQLRLALERDEFVPVFQPLFDHDGKVVALETLIRWQHPERGLLLPGEFIAVCEESGLIVELGRKVLELAARHYRLLVAQGYGHLRIAVNVSPAQFTEELVRHVDEAMRRFGVPADVLELEITEGLLMTNPEGAIELMRQMVALGVTFSIDDFGTGYSSLAYLKRFPIDRLKIDRSFVRDLGVDEDDAAICHSIISLAHALGIRTVAEGVETQMQLDWLRERRIDEVQGYLLGRPQPFEQLCLGVLRNEAVAAA